MRSLWEVPKARERNKLDGFPTLGNQEQSNRPGELGCFGEGQFHPEPEVLPDSCPEMLQPVHKYLGHQIGKRLSAWLIWTRDQRLCVNKTKLSSEPASHQPFGNLCYFL